jgi:hypothetical protein
LSAPEILLPRLRRALANLVAACDAVTDGPINEAGQTAEEALRTVMRRLLLSETLGAIRCWQSPARKGRERLHLSRRSMT